jgi:pimeloyl-ACP methyl ester carboxylesterase
MRLSLFLSALLLLFSLTACSSSSSNPAPAAAPDPLLVDSSPKPVELTTEDQLSIKATYYPVTNSPAPALLLVHMVNSNKDVWQKFATTAQQDGYAVLAIDLRGHGESSGESYDYDAMPVDVATALNWLTNRPEIAADRIGLVGASIGANLVLNAAGNDTNIKSVILLSPGLDYSGITANAALASYDKRPVMFVAAENDTYSADSARTLNSLALGQHQLQIYPGNDHGTALLNAQAGLTPMMLAWFKTTL